MNRYTSNTLKGVGLVGVLMALWAVAPNGSKLESSKSATPYPLKEGQNIISSSDHFRESYSAFVPNESQRPMAAYVDVALCTTDKDGIDSLVAGATISQFPVRYTCDLPGDETLYFQSSEDLLMIISNFAARGKDVFYLKELSLKEDCFEHPYATFFAENVLAQRFRQHLSDYFLVLRTLHDEYEAGDSQFTHEDLADYYGDVISLDVALLAREQNPSDAQRSFVSKAQEIADSDLSVFDQISAWNQLLR